MIKELVLAFVAGIVTFLSPCVLPLIPAYIFYITGVKADTEEKEDKIKYLIKILMFILGFTIVFVVLGVITVLLAFTVKNIRFYLNIVFGVLVIIFSLHFMGLISIFFLNYEKRPNLSKVPSGYLGSILIGMAFAAGWSPCVGPILGSILFFVASKGSIIKGIIQLFIFSLGLGIPLLITALFFNYVQPMVNFLKRNTGKVKFISGLFLFFIGILILSGTLSNITMYLNKFAYFLEKNIIISNYILSIILFLMSIAILIPVFLKKKIILINLIFANIFIILALLSIFNIFSLIQILINYFEFEGLESYLKME